MLEYDDGILQAATAFGKTVVCSYLISERKVSTLILLQNKSLIEQWVEKISDFLEIDEQPPEYFTKTGIKKRRQSVIGVLHGGKNTLTGIIDVAMAQSLAGKQNMEEILDSYGMVIIDECQHAASTTFVNLLKKVKSKYVYGVSANIKRGDKLEKIIPMLIGSVRHSYSALESSHDQEFNHYFIPRYTRVVDTVETKENINKAFTLIMNNEVRNRMIMDDVKEIVNNKKTPIILTKMKEHAKYLAKNLNGIANHIFVLYGDNSDKENNEIVMKLKNIPRNETVILVATGQKVGEGFDFPRLDVLFLVSPVSFEGRLEQYVGRLNRSYEGKKSVFVYDYVDSHMKFFNRMYEKRLRTYKKIGFTLWEEEQTVKQRINSIFDSGNYSEKFELDLVEAEKEIVISSPRIQLRKINRFIDIVKTRQEKGVEITVITTNPENVMLGNYLVCIEMINNMKEIGIHVIAKDEVEEHFAVIDNRIVWHGGMNLLGKEDIWDNLMRIENPEVASELLEIGLHNF